MSVPPFYEAPVAGHPRQGDIYAHIPSVLPPRDILIVRSAYDELYHVRSPELTDQPFQRPEERLEEDIVVRGKLRRIVVLSPETVNARSNRILVVPMLSLDNLRQEVQERVRAGRSLTMMFMPAVPARQIARDSYLDFTLIHAVRMNLAPPDRRVARLALHARNLLVGSLARYFGVGTGPSATA